MRVRIRLRVEWYLTTEHWLNSHFLFRRRFRILLLICNAWFEWRCCPFTHTSLCLKLFYEISHVSKLKQFTVWFALLGFSSAIGVDNCEVKLSASAGTWFFISDFALLKDRLETLGVSSDLTLAGRPENNNVYMDKLILISIATVSA